MEFVFDVWDNKSARRDKLWSAVFFRAFSDALVSLGSGFMFLLFAERRKVVILEICLRYFISIALFVLFAIDLHSAESDEELEGDERIGWDIVFPIAFVVSLITIILMHVGRNSKLRRSDEDGE